MKKDTLNKIQNILYPVHIIYVVSFAMVTTSGCANHLRIPEVQQWTTHEITITSQTSYENGYTDIDVWAIFTNGIGDTLLRPAFWDGGDKWKIRFSPPDAGLIWFWTTYSLPSDKGLTGRKGSLRSVPYSDSNPLLSHGLLRMSEGKRNVIHADGKPFLVVGDTPWSIPFRATTDQVKEYAADRMKKGFNTALLMSVQPDMYAEGPDARNTIQGFARGFDDLHEGHLNKLRPLHPGKGRIILYSVSRQGRSGNN